MARGQSFYVAYARSWAQGTCASEKRLYLDMDRLGPAPHQVDQPNPGVAI